MIMLTKKQFRALQWRAFKRGFTEGYSSKGMFVLHMIAYSLLFVYLMWNACCG